jgi:hypothetical protein
MSETFDGRIFVQRMGNKRLCSVCGAEEAVRLVEITSFDSENASFIEFPEVPSRRCPNGPHYADWSERPQKPPTQVDITPDVARKWWQR